LNGFAHATTFPARLLAMAAYLLVATLAALTGTQATAQVASQAEAAAPAPDKDTQWIQSLNTWRAQRASEIDAPDGWLTLVGLEWLQPGSNAVGAAADNQIRLHGAAPDHLGLIVVNPDNVRLQASPQGFPADLQIDGKPAIPGPLNTTGPKPSIITWHSLTLQVLNRGGRYTLRVKDSAAPARASFHGLQWFPPDPRLRVQAQWIPYTPAHVEKIPTATGATLDLPSPGAAEFTLDGKQIRLEPVIEDPRGNVLFFILRDQTRYDSTYETARYLHTGLPDHGLDQPGTLTLDFNRLENPPCAYSTFASCPLPPMDNRLLIQLQAGEKRYNAK
jgi:uncharacterized protein (DUF1684 family)